MRNYLLAAMSAAVILGAASAALTQPAAGGGEPNKPAATAPAVPMSVPPLTYNAISDTKYYPKPELPKLGPAGFVFKDPTFGCPILRVSDGQTMPGRSIMTPATAFSNPWNSDSTLFCVQADGAMNVPFRFDPNAMTARPISCCR